MAANCFDYVVIGGGTAGLTIASRLAEDPSVSVVVIEAGIRYKIAAPFVSSISGADIMFVGTKEVLPNADWKFFTEPEEESAGKDEVMRAASVLEAGMFEILPKHCELRKSIEMLLFSRKEFFC